MVSKKEKLTEVGKNTVLMATFKATVTFRGTDLLSGVRVLKF